MPLRDCISCRARPVVRCLIGVLVAVQVSGCKEQILHNLSETDANRLMTKLDDRRIDAEKIHQADGSWALAVDPSRSLEALKYLSEARLLNRNVNSQPDRSPLVSNREDRRFRLERSLSRELENTLANIPGVLEARVHLNLPLVDPVFGQPIGEAGGSASVFVLAQNATALKSQDISNLIGGASGVPAASVSVLIDEPALEEQHHRTVWTEIDQESELIGLVSWLRDYRLYGLGGAAALVLLSIWGLWHGLRSRAAQHQKALL